ncbi:TlpA family protein disulfide reductase [Formosa sp. S-31]|uniref:TlpA family protein disulfide reductase n=1 Tax=Formosa sp. S-31 TaxID=2790949 RepID=UPI003EBABA02
MKKLILAFIICPLLTWAQNSISGTFIPASEFKAAILYKLELANTVYIDNATITDGHFNLKADAGLKPGMYRIVYALPQEQYNFDFIYNNENIVFTFDQDKGVSFQSSEENTLLSDYRDHMQEHKARINSIYNEPTPNTSEYLQVIKDLNKTQTQFEKASEGTIAHHFIIAEKPYIPEGYEDAETFFNNYKTHFFDSIDFNDTVLQNSGFLIETCLNYVFIFVDQTQPNTTFQNNIDHVVQATSKAPQIQKTLLEILWTQFKNQQNETVANYISTKYLIDTLDPVADKVLLQEIKAFKNTALGNKAPEFSWTDQGIKTQLSDLEGKDFYIITFWSSTCSHCLNELPVLKDYLKNKSNIQVIAIGLEDEPGHWKQTIKNYPDFTQIYGEGHWDNPISIDYGVTGTPSFFVLDKNKVIQAKPDDVEELISYLDLQL